MSGGATPLGATGAAGGTAAGLPPHARDAASVARDLGADPSLGLTSAEAARASARLGRNVFDEPPRVSPWSRLAAQFRQRIVWILLVAAGVAAALGDPLEAAAIVAIVLLNALLGFFQEERAARTLEALRRLATPTARVVRDGALAVLPAADVVPGDRIALEAGDQVPADARLALAFGLRTQEAALTGESEPVDKQADPVLPAATPLADRRNMVHAGTTVAAGKAEAVVVRTGMRTELGRIAGLLQRAERRPTPLERRLDELGRVLVVVCLAIVAVISAAQLLRGGGWLEVFLLSVSLAVAAVPEGLPAVVTVALALGLQRMARRNALVRKLPSIETLGSVQAICTDKTGTLTRNEMTVRAAVVGPRGYAVSGAGYAPRGAIERESGPEATPEGDSDLARALAIGARCNNARLEAPGDPAGDWAVIGDPTEGALLVAARKGGVPEAPARGESLVYEIPFEPERRMMSVVTRDAAGRATLHAKGAPETVLARSDRERWEGRDRPLTEERRREILEASAALSARALRVLAVASREVADAPGPPAEDRLVFAGIFGMQDPPREEARAAVATCVAAGIRPVMITGDHPETALAVARELAIAGAGDVAVTGSDLDAMDDAALRARVDRLPVYARVTAEHKLRVVRAWRARGYVVAMTGDGVNDAAAVQAADVGIAMGRTGSDVTREAADMVLLDDNFASIVAAVEEGRGLFDDVGKVVRYLLATNTGEILFMFFAAVAGWPVPLLPIQILWVNLVSDGLPALALGVEPPEKDAMRRPPRAPTTRVLSWAEGRLLVARGALVAGVAAAGFAIAYAGDPSRVPHARVVAFCVVAFAQLAYALAFRSERYTLPELGFASNLPLIGAIAASAALQWGAVEIPALGSFFRVERPIGADWPLIAFLALLPVTIVETAKLARAWGRRASVPATG